MPQPPFAISAEDPKELVNQIQLLMGELYEERIGGAITGDVFSIDDSDILTLDLATEAGLEKISNKLKVKLDGSSLRLSEDGLSVNQVAYDVVVQEGDANRADNSDAALYIDFNNADFDVGVVGNECNITVNDGGINHNATSNRTHDGDTLQLDGVNSNGGAFAFTTTGTVTFNQLLEADAGIQLDGDMTTDRWENEDTNTYLGVSVCGNDSNSGAIRNTGIGSYALYLLTSGDYNTALGSVALNTVTTESYNTALGAYALQTIAGNNNVAIGYKAINNCSGASNVGIGFEPLKTVSGSYNIAVGRYAMDSPSGVSGSYNIAVGRNAMHITKAITGSYNIAIGDGAMYNTANLVDTSGNYNIAIGDASLQALTTGDYNVCIGRATGSAITTADANTIIGFQAGNVLTGINNVLVGYQAGNTLTTGGNNIIIGYDADANAAGDSNEIVIGYNVIGNGSNTVTIGDSNITCNYLTGALKLKEIAAAVANTAGYGQLWVKNTTPCELWFTDDAGTDTQIV